MFVINDHFERLVYADYLEEHGTYAEHIRHPRTKDIPIYLLEAIAPADT